MRQLAEDRRGHEHKAAEVAPATPGRTSAASRDVADGGRTAYASPSFWPGAAGGEDEPALATLADTASFETDTSGDDAAAPDDHDEHDDHDHGDDDLKLASAKQPTSEAAAPAKEGCGCGTCPTCDAKKKGGGGAPKPAAPAQTPGKGVFFDDSRSRKTGSVPIDKGGDKWRTFFSAKLSDVPGDVQPDVLAARGEVQLTKCQQSDVDKGECKRITPFTPEYKTKIIIASGPDATDGKVVTDGGKPMACNDNEHHCTTSVPERKKDNAAGAKYVNLVVAAGTHSSKLTSKDTMHVDNDHGGVAVTRWFAGAAPTGGTAKGKRTLKKPVAAQDHRKDHVTLQATVHDVKPGDVLSADAKIKVKAIKGGGARAGCHGARDPLISHQIFASKHKDGIKSKIATLTAQNGVNVMLGKSRTFEKSGAAQMPGTTPSTVYVSVVSWGGRSCSANGDKFQVTGGHLTVQKKRG
jgi:hypothetical protein